MNHFGSNLEQSMKSITIHNLDDKLDNLIRARAKTEGLSLNQTIQELIRKALGLKKESDHRDDFLDLFGTWTKEDEDEFLKQTKDFREVEDQDWQ